MTGPRRRPSRALRGPLAWFTNQRGEALTALILVGDALISLAIFLLGSASILSVQDRQQLETCIQSVSAHTASLKQRYSRSDDIPADDPSVLDIKTCKAILDHFATQTLPTFGSNSAFIQNLRDAIDGVLVDLARCRIDAVFPNAPIAGKAANFQVLAKIPLSGAGASGSAILTLPGSSVSAPLTSFSGLLWDSQFTVSADHTPPPGTESEVTVTAQSVVGQATNGQCPGGITPNASGQCIVSCTSPPTTIVWANPPIPQIKAFTVIPSTVVKGSVEPLLIVWNIANAETATIDQGIGEVDPKNGFTLDVPPDQDTVYTLTATGTRPQDTKTATAKVTVQAAPTLTLTSPGNQTTVTGTSVVVSGTLSGRFRGGSRRSA